MAMSVGSSSGSVMCDINTTPLIDVMLVLLVTLIVSLPIMTHAVKLDMPESNNPPPQDQRPEVIDLSDSGRRGRSSGFARRPWPLRLGLGASGSGTASTTIAGVRSGSGSSPSKSVGPAARSLDRPKVIFTSRWM